MSHGKKTKLPMLESDLQATIIDAASKLGYLHYHTHDSRRSDFGFPDIVLVHDEKRRVIYIECKSESGTVTPEQNMWHDALARADQEVYLVYPKHLDELMILLMQKEKPTLAERFTYDCAIVCMPETEALPHAA